LDRLAAETGEVLEGEAGDVFAELLGLSGSSAGARPKVMVGVSKDKKRIIHGQQSLQKSFAHWMVKFASSNDAKDIGAIEYAYSLMARAAGLEMMPTYLFPAKKGVGYFGVQRFDRQGDKRIHMHTVSGLLHADHRLPSLDYEHIMRATLELTRNIKEVEKILRMAAFNVFAHNRDDHAKNFSFLMDAKGNWSVAPAYDLTFSGGPGGEHSTTIMGEGKNPGKEQLLKLAEKFSITKKTANLIIDEVCSAIRKWPTFADEAGVSKISKQLIITTSTKA
jgi:serine/threonine-protein kinase HipA